MLLKTKHFGEINIDEKKIINFEDGIPGFENEKRFIVLYEGDDKSPFRWMQSIDNPDLAFAMVDPIMIVPDYDGEIPKEAVEKLEIEKPEDIMVLSIVVVREEVEKNQYEPLKHLLLSIQKIIKVCRLFLTQTDIL